MDTLLALEAMEGAMEGALDIDFSSEDDDDEEYLTSLASLTGSIAASLISFSLSLLDLVLVLGSTGFSVATVSFSMVSLAFSSPSLLELELLLLLERFNFSLTFPIRPDEKIPFDLLLNVHHRSFIR